MSESPEPEKTYRERLTRASFRGFEFLTDSHDAKGGRRLVVHEYPEAEEPWVEDLGGKAWDYKLNAYFISDNYDLERNGFLEKLNEKGADWLTHPWLGEKWVRAHHWDLHESNDKGGMCTLKIDFVEGGEQPFLVAVDKVDVAYERIRRFTEKSMLSDIDSFLAKLEREVFAVLAMVDNIIAFASAPLVWVSRVLRLVASVKATFHNLMALPKAYANAFRSLLGIFNKKNIGNFSEQKRLRVISALTKNASTLLAYQDLPTEANLRKSAIALNDFHAQNLIAAACEAALNDYQTKEGKDAALNQVLSAIDTLLPTLPDTIYQEALDMRAAMIDALLAQNLNPSQTRQIIRPHPSVLLAHRLEVDETLFLIQNKVRHPLFVQGEVRA